MNKIITLIASLFVTQFAFASMANFVLTDQRTDKSLTLYYYPPSVPGDVRTIAPDGKHFDQRTPGPFALVLVTYTNYPLGQVKANVSFDYACKTSTEPYCPATDVEVQNFKPVDSGTGLRVTYSISGGTVWLAVRD